MFEFITNPEDRGQVGIGTLIVFIAMVLVAAIAAGVLINTAGFLQTQAEATGQESTDLVSERIDVTSEVGIVGTPDPGQLDEVRLGVSGAPGADQIDLTETTIQAVGPGGQENLVFTSSASGASEVTQLSVPQLSASQGTFDITVDYDNIEAFDAGDSGQKLVVEVDSNNDGTFDTSQSLTGSDLDGTTVDTSDGAGGDISLSLSLAEDNDVRVDLVDTNDGGSSVIGGPVTQTVGGVQFTVSDIVSTTSTDFTVNFNYNNIESIADSDSSQELSIEFYDGTTTTTGDASDTATVTSSQINDGSVTIGTSNGENSDPTTINIGADQFETDDTVVVTLSDGTGNEVGSATQTADGSGAQEVTRSAAFEATEVFNNKVANLGPNEFAIGSDGNFRTSAVLNEEKDFTILINPDAGALEDTSANEAFGESDSATLDIVSPAGATTSVELRAPDLFNNKGEAVRL